MITEEGTVKTSIVQDDNVYKELNKSTRNLGILYVVCGAIIFALGVVLWGISAFEGTDDGDNIFMLIIGAVFVVLGIFFLIICNKSAKTALQFKRVQELEFFGDYLLEKGYTDGEHTSTNKIYYKWIVKIKETQNYLFLYNMRVTALAVDKNSLPPEELNTIRSLIGKAPQPAPAQPAQNTQSEQPAQPAQNASEPAATEVPPPEPFADMTENKENKE